MAAPAEPAVVRLAREQHAALLAHDAQMLQALTRRWLGVEQGLQGAMERLARQLDQMRANGQAPSRNQLYRLQRYAELLAAAQREIAQYTAWSAGKIAGEQEQSVEQGLTDAQALIGSEMRDTGLVGNFGRLYREAVNVMAGYASDGSPLSQLLAVSYPAAVQGLTQALVDGIAQGLGPRETARKMANGLGMGLDRALLIARDQTLRAYRTANDQQYEASGVVIGKERLCAHDGRTCLACLAADGQILPLSQPMFDHPLGRCSTRPLTRLSKPRTLESGEQWFSSQPEAEQRRMMGDKRFEAWQAGQFKFADLAAVTHHDVWGDGLRVRTLSELLGGTPPSEPKPVVVQAALPATPGPVATPQPPQPGAFKDLQEAQQWASQAYPHITWEFGGAHVDTINPTLAQFHQLAQEYPEVAQRLAYVGTFAGWPQPVWTGKIASSWAFATTDGKAIGLNPLLYGNPAEFSARLTRNVQSGYHPAGCDTVESVLTHEFGHQVQNWLESTNKAFSKYVLSNGLGLVGDTTRAFVKGNKRLPNASRYCRENQHEKWAENFAALHHSPETQQVAYTRRMGEFLAFMRQAPWSDAYTRLTDVPASLRQQVRDTEVQPMLDRLRKMGVEGAT